jgi:hypothetical protein
VQQSSLGVGASSGRAKDSENTEEDSVAKESSGTLGLLLDVVGVVVWPEGIRA